MLIYLLGVFQEYCVIINLYNGDLIPFISEDIEYSLVDILILVTRILYFKRNRKNLIDVSLISLILFSHLQWTLHSPFHEWPSWWIGDKSTTDIRHRTEYYDTHVMCFIIWLLMFFEYIRYFNIFLL